MAELVPRAAFTSNVRRPIVSFYTSNRAKYSQANAVFEAAGLRLAYRAEDERSYPEDYSGSSRDLLSGAIREILRRGGTPGSFFFIEDTSVRIEALSSLDSDYPGLATKEWFNATSFAEVTSRIEELGGDRRCVVKSDIGLYVPGVASPIFFHGETAGALVEEVPLLEKQWFHPWLDPNSFSAWFVPANADKVLSAMSFEESLQYDFRVKSLQALIDRLAEYSTVANSGPAAFTRPQPTSVAQPSLFDVAPALLLVVGATCSGKTTFGLGAQQLDWRFVDASSVVRLIRDARGSVESIGTFANQLLDAEGPDVIARYISRHLLGPNLEGPTVVTGFRAIEEVELLRSIYSDTKVVALFAPQKLRYERFLARNSREPRTFAEFAEIDEDQHRLGLLRVTAELSDVLVENVFSEGDYQAQVARVVGVPGIETRGVTSVEVRPSFASNQLYRSLAILRDAGRPLTTQEIMLNSGNLIRNNNVNKMLKRYPELARRQESPGANVRYQITARGLAFLSAADRLWST